MNVSKFVKTAVSAAVLVGASVAANAGVYTLPNTVTTDVPGSFSAFSGGDAGSPIDDVFNFTLGTGALSSGYSAVVDNIDLRLLGINVNWNALLKSMKLFNSAGTEIASVSSANGASSLSFGRIATTSGNYSLKVAGVVGPQGNGYLYRGSISAYTTPAAPVPEPETYAMLLAGLGLMGTIARRRNKAAK